MRQRLVRGAQAQLFGHVVRVVIQVGGVSLFTAVWGLHLYGEWLILAAVPTYLAFSDIGFVSAAGNEMVMAAGRDDKAHALEVFQAVSQVVLVVCGALMVVLPSVALLVPLRSLLNLRIMSDFTAGWVLVTLGLDAMFAIYSALLYGGYSCVGQYGRGTFAISAIALIEFIGLACVILLGGGPALAATAMLAGRCVGTIVMYVGLRRAAPWLRFGRPRATRSTLRALLSPALASGAIPLGFAFNLQGMVILVGSVLGPASAAIFSTVRTVSRSVIQLLASVSAVAAPEMSKAFGEGNRELLQILHRRGCQIDVWLAAVVVGTLAVAGEPILRLWTDGNVGTEGSLLYLFLIITVIDSFWYTSFIVMFATNRHQGIAVDYVVASVLTVPAALVLIYPLGLPGVACAILALEIFMLFSALRRAIPATHDTLRGFGAAVREPPLRPLLRLFRRPRAL